MVEKLTEANASSRPLVLSAALSIVLHGLAVAAIVPHSFAFWPVNRQQVTPTEQRPHTAMAETDKAETQAIQSVADNPPPRAIGDTGFEAVMVFVTPGTFQRAPTQSSVAQSTAAGTTPADTPSPSAKEPSLDNPTLLAKQIAPPHLAAVKAARQHERRLDLEDAARWSDTTPNGKEALHRTAERYRRSAEKGRHFAGYNLALAQLHGRGIERDTQAAARQLEQTAKAGYPPAMLRLAEMHLADVGPPRDPIEAAAWYRVAAAVGSRAGQVASSLMDAQFTLEQRADARRRAIALQATLSPTRALDWQAKDLALHKAIANGNPAEVNRLLNDGADGNITDADGRNGLISAAWRGHTGVAAMLIDAGIDPDSVDNEGRSALMWASINGHTSLVRLLADKIANVDTRDADGLTPLMRAAWNGHAAVVRELLGAGANPALRDEAGKTALQRAHLSKDPAVVHLLKQAANKS